MTEAGLSPEDLLARLTGDPEASFREGQREAVEALVGTGARVLCVQRTGWGKSAVYFIATAMLRDRGAGLTILVSPLIALMRNQVLAAEGLGITARTINSANRDEWPRILAEIERDEIDILLVSPERLANEGFRAAQLPDLLRRCGLLVIDEAHCISDWGHDFRPDYRRIAAIVDDLPAQASVLCTTATANDRVIDDIVSQLGSEVTLLTIRGMLDRPSLRLEVVELPSQAERLAWLATEIPAMEGNGIVYCLTVRDTRVVAAWLNDHGVSAMHYSGQDDTETRVEIEEALLSNRVKAVVATSALGMGYDKPDLGFVIHFQAPGSPIAYYQQVGRAGRALHNAHAVLLRGSEDREIQDYFIRQAFPPPEQIDAVLARLESAAGEPVSTGELLREVNIGPSRLGVMLKSLDVDGAIRKSKSRWVRTEQPYSYDPEHVRSITAVRRREQEMMLSYGADGTCLMERLRTELDDPGSEACGRCAVCTEPIFGDALDHELVLRAIQHLRGQPIELKPKAMAPTESGRRKIPDEERLEPGRALSVYGDAGWGHLVRRGRLEERRYPDDLLEACVGLLAEWAPDPAPEWITVVPSLRRPQLLPDFARRLGAALGLEYVDAIRQLRETLKQQQMENSSQQLENVQGAFQVDGEQVRSSPVLLIDGIIDSGWKMTEVGGTLRRAGIEAVLPLALASSAVRG